MVPCRSNQIWSLLLLGCSDVRIFFGVGRIECLFGDGCWNMNLLPPFQRWNFQASQECQSIVLAATWKGLLLENCYVLLRKTPQKYSHATRACCACLLHGFTIPSLSTLTAPSTLALFKEQGIQKVTPETPTIEVLPPYGVVLGG